MLFAVLRYVYLHNQFWLLALPYPAQQGFCTANMWLGYPNETWWNHHDLCSICSGHQHTQAGLTLYIMQHSNVHQGLVSG